jgi:hypothetical protein
MDIQLEAFPQRALMIPSIEVVAPPTVPVVPCLVKRREVTEISKWYVRQTCERKSSSMFRVRTCEIAWGKKLTWKCSIARLYNGGVGVGPPGTGVGLQAKITTRSSKINPKSASPCRNLCGDLNSNIAKENNNFSRLSNRFKRHLPGSPLKGIAPDD